MESTMTNEERYEFACQCRKRADAYRKYLLTHKISISFSRVSLAPHFTKSAARPATLDVTLNNEHASKLLDANREDAC